MKVLSGIGLLACLEELQCANERVKLVFPRMRVEYRRITLRNGTLCKDVYPWHCSGGARTCSSQLATC